MVQDYLNEAAKTRVETAAVLCFQSFGEFLRWNPHWHAIVLEGGFDESGNFIHIPFGNLQEMTECFRGRVVKFFFDGKLINQDMADNLLTWRHSGFSLDASILLPSGSSKERESLAQYLARPPISLKKVSFESFHGKVLFHTSYNEYNKRKPEALRGNRFYRSAHSAPTAQGRTIYPTLRIVLLTQSRQMDREALCCPAGSGWVEAEAPRFS